MSILSEFLFGGVRNKHLYQSVKTLRNELDCRLDKISERDISEVTKLTPELEFLLKDSHLVLFRQVATPLNEVTLALSYAEKLQLKPVIFEFYDDVFVGKGNAYKRSLGKLPIFKFTSSKKSVDVFEYSTVVDFNKFTGHSIREVFTVKNESIINLHHDLFEYAYRGIKPIIVDASSWFNKFEYNAENYYTAFLSLFVRNNVLAEIFDWDGEGKKFTDDIVTPAFCQAKKQFGLKPLILNYQPWFEQDRTYWDCYPTCTNDFLKKKGYSE